MSRPRKKKGGGPKDAAASISLSASVLQLSRAIYGWLRELGWPPHLF